MPRQQRRKSESGIYHIMLRGINQQQIFQDREDNAKFLQILANCKAVSEFELYAYCLMGNHVHILLKEGKEPPELIFKRIGSRYVYWYNTKYQRVGHLFQDRYKSEPVDTDEYFLTVLRYIHQNPIKAGIVRKCEEYKYSSYNEYFSDNKLIDKSFVKSLINEKEFIAFHKADDDSVCLDIPDKITVRLTDEQAVKIIKRISKCENVEQFQNLDNKQQKKYLTQLRKQGISIRQLSRLTGVSKGIIERIY